MIRRASDKESDELTTISFTSKRYWKYPESYFDVWKDELTITSAYINNNEVYTAIVDAKTVGFFSIVKVNEDFQTADFLIREGFWLDHIFVHPDFIRKRVGSELISFAKELCRQKKISYIYILSDPYAKGFYDRVGAQFIEEIPSNIRGRTVSLYKFSV